MHSKGDVEALDAFTTVNGNLDQRRKYGITLKEGLEVWNRKFKKAKTAETVAKMKKTVSDFIAFLNQHLLKNQLQKFEKHWNCIGIYSTLQPSAFLL